MRLETLRLIAYGPFTDKPLDFGSQFTIVYGRNEAGKTSALRALRDGLFGIPGQTADAFLHPYANLRIGVALSANDNRLEFVRRKGRTQTLRTPDDVAVVEDHVLERMLHGLTRDAFESMFGISHEALRSGGHELAEGRGEIGQLLFASAAGMASLQTMLLQLDQEAGELYAPRASSKAINQSLRQIHECDQELRRKQVGIARFQENQKALADALRGLTDLDEKIDELRREGERLKRIREAAPTIAARKQAISELENLKAVPLLDADFGKRLSDAEQELRTANLTEGTCRNELEHIAEAIAKLHVPSDLLASDGTIRSAFESKGVIEKSKDDCKRREAELSKTRQSLAQQVEQLRPGLTPDDAAKLEPGMLVRKRVQELAALAPQHQERQRFLKEAFSAAQKKVAQCEWDISQLPGESDVAPLEALAKQARREFDPEKTEKFKIDIRALEANIDIGLASLSPWAGTSDELERLTPPAVGVIEEFRVEFQEAAAAEKAASTKLADIERDLARTKSERGVIVAAYEIPTLENLTETRSRRDLGWAAVKSVWRDGNADAPQQHEFLKQTGQTDLAAGYEFTVADADQVADRMRAEAERVERVTSLNAAIAGLEEQREHAAAIVKSAVTASEELSRRWREAWSATGIAPESPTAMLAWMRRREGFLQVASSLRQLRLQLESSEQAEAGFVEKLSASLTDYGVVVSGGLLYLLETAEAVVRAAKETATKRQALNAVYQSQAQEVARIEKDLEEAHQVWSQWQEQWAEVLHSMGLAADTSPAATESYLRDLQDIGTNLRAATQLQARIDKMRDDAHGFADTVSRLVSSLNPELSRLEPEAAISQLYQALLSANEDRKLLSQEQKRHREFELKLRQAMDLVKRNTEELAGLCGECGVDDVAAAREVWERSNQRRELQRTLNECDQRLLLVSVGKTIEDFLADAQSVDFDSIASRLEELERSTAALREERSVVEGRRRSLDAEALAMQGGDEAATAAQQISGLTGKLATDVEQYVRLKTAAFVLHRAIERYREENQGPVLEHAAKLFSELTCGSFAGLRVENVDGESILVGVRPGPGNQTLDIAGMSDGTRDQLYLALRIASLEHYFAAHEAIPFIVDDVLLNYDDQRAQAALAALNRLSGHTQVIFFTHHRHLAELALSCTSATMTEVFQ